MHFAENYWHTQIDANSRHNSGDEFVTVPPPPLIYIYICVCMCTPTHTHAHRVKEQRTAQQEGKLTGSRLKLLVDTDFEFSLKRASFKRRTHEAKGHAQRAGGGVPSHNIKTDITDVFSPGSVDVCVDGGGVVLGVGGGGGGWETVECPVCNSGDREESMIICDKCDQGVHMYCLVPELLAVPQGDWYVFFYFIFCVSPFGVMIGVGR